MGIQRKLILAKEKARCCWRDAKEEGLLDHGLALCAYAGSGVVLYLVVKAALANTMKEATHTIEISEEDYNILMKDWFTSQVEEA